MGCAQERARLEAEVRGWTRPKNLLAGQGCYPAVLKRDERHEHWAVRVARPLAGWGGGVQREPGGRVSPRERGSKGRDREEREGAVEQPGARRREHRGVIMCASGPHYYHRGQTHRRSHSNCTTGRHRTKPTQRLTHTRSSTTHSRLHLFPHLHSPPSHPPLSPSTGLSHSDHL
ncbi:hypothetical protein CALCODRAFT_92952 [Calocera cornea HHB12733]|uniref:Uncharacterized protein n=1 Tax=Calocera cornea HHB12733 TaxID=1353952 RepID=A0A165D952_9BASI|nr:hypothetical protein CALCODRAFT_92952 [Calocera cornea HHB12733]